MWTSPGVARIRTAESATSPMAEGLLSIAKRPLAAQVADEQGVWWLSVAPNQQTGSDNATDDSRI